MGKEREAKGITVIWTKRQRKAETATEEGDMKEEEENSGMQQLGRKGTRRGNEGEEEEESGLERLGRDDYTGIRRSIDGVWSF